VRLVRLGDCHQLKRGASLGGLRRIAWTSFGGRNLVDDSRARCRCDGSCCAQGLEMKAAGFDGKRALTGYRGISGLERLIRTKRSRRCCRGVASHGPVFETKVL
jgi:hypothetical protein